MRLVPCLLLASCALLACDGDGGGSFDAGPSEEGPQGDGDGDTVCDAFLACVQQVAPETFATVNASYGPDGHCWNNGDAARAACLNACTSSLAAYAESGRCAPFDEADEVFDAGVDAQVELVIEQVVRDYCEAFVTCLGFTAEERMSYVEDCSASEQQTLGEYTEKSDECGRQRREYLVCQTQSCERSCDGPSRECWAQHAL
jgi:hypothetical protein